MYFGFSISLLTQGDISPIIILKENEDIHAITQDFDAPFLIATGELLDGYFPIKAQALVKEFVLKYQKELEEMWETEKYIKLPPID
ncbi:MAG: DUF4160 domain-containing protein [Lachnospiraceae bacterium]|nr:DUF4160 domain-containing protein [Lachnospiraceae bacterium]